MKEDNRQAFHFLLGCAVIAFCALFGKSAAAVLAGAALLIGMALVHLKLTGRKLGPVDWFLMHFARPHEVAGYGALTYAAAVLAILTLTNGEAQALSSLFILAAGDAASTVVGLRGKHRLPYNRKKTAEGTLAFFAAALPSAVFAGPAAILVSAAAALAESLEARVDDNLVIAVVCVLGFQLAG